MCGNKRWDMVDVVTHTIEKSDFMERAERLKSASPVAWTKVFEPAEGETATVYVSPTLLAPEAKTFRRIPMVLLGCTNCYFLAQFAWLPIVRKALKND